MQITEKQIKFFETFGFLKLKQAFKDEIEWITSEFTKVFTDRGVIHDGTKRSCIVPFIDQREKLSTLIDHPVVLAAGKALLGEDFNYLGGDGNYYSGNTVWHPDGNHDAGEYLKMAFYLDAVRGDSGALRVIPGSHRRNVKWEGYEPGRSEELWGIPPTEVPAVILDSDPGDLLIFDHNTLHASYGGGGFRRMFTINLCRHCEAPAKIADLESFLNSSARFWIDQTHSELMRKGAGPERQRHLQQVIQHEHGLPALAAKCRETMAEPARG